MVGSAESLYPYKLVRRPSKTVCPFATLLLPLKGETSPNEIRSHTLMSSLRPPNSKSKAG